MLGSIAPSGRAKPSKPPTAWNLGLFSSVLDEAVFVERLPVHEASRKIPLFVCCLLKSHIFTVQTALVRRTRRVRAMPPGHLLFVVFRNHVEISKDVWINACLKLLVVLMIHWDWTFSLIINIPRNLSFISLKTRGLNVILENARLERDP